MNKILNIFLTPLLITSCSNLSIENSMEEWTLEAVVESMEIHDDMCFSTYVDVTINTDKEYTYKDLSWTDLSLDGYEIKETGFILNGLALNGTLKVISDRYITVKADFINIDKEPTCNETKFKIK